MELSAVNLTKRYGSKTAVNRLNATLTNGVYGLLGTNGAGKTTFMRLLCTVQRPTSGKIDLDGKSIWKLGERYRDVLGYLPQHFGYYPDFTALDFLLYVAALKGLDDKKAKNVSNELLDEVGLSGERRRKIKTFSGGMKQRIVIAMALVAEPELLLADEPTTALDVTIQAQILELMRDLKEKYNSAVILITHDLGVVAQFCDSVAVVYGGRVVEYGTVEQIYAREKNHPYTAGLFNCIPDLSVKAERLTPIEGRMADPRVVAQGCCFAERCKHCTEICKSRAPSAYEEDGHGILCHLFTKKEGA